MERVKVVSYIESLFSAKTEQFLYSLAKNYDCNIKLKTQKISFWKDRVDFEFEGPVDKMTLLKENFELSIAIYNLPSSLKEHQNIKKIIKNLENDRNLFLTLETDKKSKILELAKEIAEELGIYVEGNEKSLGWFKGKEVNIEVTSFDNKLRLKKFKQILFQVASIENKNKNIIKF